MLQAPDASTQLDRIAGTSNDLLYRMTIDRLAIHGPIQVNDVQPLKALIFKGLSLRARIVAIYRGLVQITFEQPHDLSTLQVDCRK